MSLCGPKNALDIVTNGHKLLVIRCENVRKGLAYDYDALSVVRERGSSDTCECNTDQVVRFARLAGKLQIGKVNEQCSVALK